ncbi:MAG: helix-turn-helix domain-containing protein [Pseudomonadales bacterium]
MLAKDQAIVTPSSLDLGQFSNVVNEMFCPMGCNTTDIPSASFKGELVNTRLDRIHLARISSSPLQVHRRKSHIAQVSGNASYLVKFQLSGEAFVQHRGIEAFLKPGDFVLCTTSDPYELRFPSNYRQAVLAVPHTLLNEMFKAPDDYLGVKMSGESPTHGLLSQFVGSLVERIDSLDADIIARLEANILDLLVTSLHAQSRCAHLSNTSKAANQLEHIKRFILMNLQDYKLSVDLIATKHGISKRYLHLLFKQDGISVSRYIQQQRLAACYRALTNNDMQHLSTTDIAFQFGFGDISHFYRCFKAHYKLTPRQIRMQAK